MAAQGADAMTVMEELHEAILTGEDDVAAELTRRGIDDGIEPQKLIDDAMIPAMAEAGQRFEDEVYFVPELLTSGRAITAALAILRPLLAAGSLHKAGSVVIGTVQGDLHDIGKNLVAVMLEGAGFEIIDLGTDVTPEEVVAAIEEHQPDLVGLSALLTTTMLSMVTIIEAIEAADLRSQVKVLVGGAPLSEKWAKEFGADAYADNANAAVGMALELVGAQ
jgi:corrinoid protein of di/trimethylamine methyltransferase